MRTDRMAYIQSDYMKQVLAENADAYNTQNHDNTYELGVEHYRKCGSPPDVPHGHDPHSIDKKRREEARRQQLYEYSAKLHNRYSSKDYISQWWCRNGYGGVSTCIVLVYDWSKIKTIGCMN